MQGREWETCTEVSLWMLMQSAVGGALGAVNAVLKIHYYIGTIKRTLVAKGSIGSRTRSSVH